MVEGSSENTDARAASAAVAEDAARSGGSGSKALHILFLTDNFPPEVNAPATRTFEHCREWVGAGHRVTVITCAPNFPKGELLEGYRNRLWQTEERSGIRVIRVWSYITANEGFGRRVADYMSYMVTATLAAPFVRGVDVVIGTSPQFFTVCAAYVVSRLKRVPFVFELRDIWPESIRAVGAMKESAWLRRLERLERFLYRKAALIVAVTESFRKYLVGRGVDPGKIEVVLNGVDTSRFEPAERDTELAERYGLTGKFVAGYIGTHGMAHALETVLEAASQLKARPDGDRFRIVLLGDGARKQALVKRAEEMRLDNVLFLDSVPTSEVVRYWSLLDVSIIHLKGTPLFENVIPSKLFESMAMGVPVLHGVKGESAEIVENAGAGLVFEPEDGAVLAEGIVRLERDAELYARLRAAGLSAARSCDRSRMARSMLDAIEDLVGWRSEVRAGER